MTGAEVLQWEGGEDAHCVTGRRNGEIVVRIYRHESHEALDDDIWEVEINGYRLEPNFRHLDDAQDFAAAQIGV